eukprot:629533-Amphidinium_carterae.1
MQRLRIIRCRVMSRHSSCSVLAVSSPSQLLCEKGLKQFKNSEVDAKCNSQDVTEKSADDLPSPLSGKSAEPVVTERVDCEGKGGVALIGQSAYKPLTETCVGA